MGTCHPDIRISKRNMRITASYPFCVLLVCLHNSCPVDALQFLQNFTETFEKTSVSGVGGSSTSFFLKYWDFLTHPLLS